MLDEGKEPVVIDYSKAFFPVLLVVLVLRSFIAEPFRIPSNSMMPTLLTGDFILVNKFAYGLRLPITNKKFVALGEPKRGDVVVFRPPHHPDQDWIKRVVGLPGDRVGYHDNQVTLNGELLAYAPLGLYEGKGNGSEMSGAEELREDLPGRAAPRPRAHRPAVPRPGGRRLGSAAGSLFRDGRQPRQQRRQPILGNALPAGAEPARQGVPDLDEYRWRRGCLAHRQPDRVTGSRGWIDGDRSDGSVSGAGFRDLFFVTGEDRNEAYAAWHDPDRVRYGVGGGRRVRLHGHEADPDVFGVLLGQAGARAAWRSEPGITDNDPAKIKDLLFRRLDISYADNVKPENVKIVRKDAGYLMTVDYEVRKPLIANIDVVGKFHADQELRRGAVD